MQPPHPLLARFERAIALTEAERLSVNAVPFTVETLKAGEGPSWAGDRASRASVILEGLVSTSRTMQDNVTVERLWRRVKSDAVDW